MGGGKDKERKIEKVKEKLEGAKSQEELMKMLIEEVSRNRVEREDFQERMDRRDKEWEEMKQKWKDMEKRLV